MRVRSAIISVLLALGVAGSVVAGAEASAAVAHTSGVHAEHVLAGPDMKYRG